MNLIIKTFSRDLLRSEFLLLFVEINIENRMSSLNTFNCDWTLLVWLDM